jgi:hypothetical protein
VAELEKLVIPFLVWAATFIAFIVILTWLVEHVSAISEKSKSLLLWLVGFAALLVWIGAAAYLVHTQCENVSGWDFLEAIVGE